MDAANMTYASPTADAAFAKVQLPIQGLLSRVLENVNGWSIALTILIGLVAYDQGWWNHELLISSAWLT